MSLMKGPVNRMTMMQAMTETNRMAMLIMANPI